MPRLGLSNVEICHSLTSPIIKAKNSLATIWPTIAFRQKPHQIDPNLADGVEPEARGYSSLFKGFDHSIYLGLDTSAKYFILQQVDDGLEYWRSLRGIVGFL